MRSLLDWPRASRAKGASIAVNWFVGDECGTIGYAVGVGRQLMLLVVLVVINKIIETSRASGWDHQRRPRASEAGLANGANKVDRSNLESVSYFIYLTINKARVAVATSNRASLEVDRVVLVLVPLQ